MAIRVVNTSPDPRIIKKAICSGCGVSLEYVPNDVKEYKSYDYGGGCDIVKHIDCPACGKQLNVGR